MACPVAPTVSGVPDRLVDLGQRAWTQHDLTRARSKPWPVRIGGATVAPG